MNGVWMGLGAAGLLVGVGLVYALLRTVWIIMFQHRYVFRPGLRQLARYPSDAGLPYESFTLLVGAGEVVTGWYVPGRPDQPASGVHILFCHGNGGNIGDLVDVAAVMTQCGFTMVFFDYRGYGASSGKPSEKGTYADAQACYRYLVEQRGIPAQHIIWFGHSLGAAVACQAAIQCPAAGLVLEGAFISIPVMAARSYPRLPVKAFCRIRYDNGANIGTVRMPVMVAHSREDTVCPPEQGRQLFAAAREPKRLVEIGGGHNNGGVLTNPDYRDAILAFAVKYTQVHQ